MIRIFFAFLMLLLTFNARAVDMYNSIATAYVTTTISQDVVFDSTMQAGGTFTFSVLAHNGGGRANQSDTANVKIQFYTSNGTLVSSVNSSYSANLPQPTASGSGGLSGNPQVDPAVPWTTLTISSVNCGGSCSNVAYAKISMYGVDGSYWAGDYGPWYRAPTFTLNGGANMAYNPEFGPYNGITAQGWTSSPGFGACQGAWGGSNACIVNSSGTPGTSTVGLVANQNGGGPSATGGTTSGQPGGYNSTMTTTNAAPAPGPTLVSTTTTNQTKNIIVGTQSQTITTPVTTKTYSDGSTVVTNGTSTTTVNSTAAFTGVKFGPAQVADTQWNVQACTQTNSCQIYSTAPGTTYNTGSPTSIASGQYVTFVPNNGNDKATLPWTMLLVNSSDGTYTSLGNSKILVEGMENGKIYLFVDNGQYNGTLLSANIGLTGQGMTFTGIQNPTVAQTNTDASMMSTSPLAAGQTGGTGSGTSGLAYTTYYGGGPTPSTNNLTAISTGTVSTVNYDWSNGTVLDSGLGDGVIVRFTGYFLPNRTGVFQFGTTSDDGAKLTVNGVTIVNAWQEQGPTFYNGSTSLTSGQPVTIELWYYENGGGAMIQLWWFNEATQQWEIIPESMLATSSGYFTYTAPVIVSSSTTDSTSTSTSISVSTTSNSFSADGYTYSFTGTDTTTTVTTITTPVTTSTWSDGSTTTTYGSSSTSQTVTDTYNITPGQNLTPADRNPYRGTLVNAIDINQTIGSANNTIQATQKGAGNNIEMTVSGTGNNVSANQGFTVNTLGVPSESTMVSNNNFAAISVTGNNNSVTSQQTGLMNSIIIGVSGNYNSASVNQSGNNNQSYTTISGSNNSSTVGQTGNSNLSAITMTGNGNNATVTQSGNYANGALLNLTNAGGPSTVNLIQQANTQGQTFVVEQTCTNGAGCSVSVRQNK